MKLAVTFLQREQAIAWLKDQVSPQRLDHILGVESTAMTLAAHYHLDTDAAATAGLLHDLAKFFPPQKLLAIAKEHHLALDPVLETTPHLLHADVSAIVAQQEFKVTDPDILNGIRCHTLGSPAMSPLACVIFVADAIEPTRGNDPTLAKVRQVAPHNLYQAVRMTCDYTLDYLVNHQKIIHPRMILTRNWALHREKET
ncbi:MAG: bis(5'-nucleosyl)-tetraphosphatase (symmetrical) YqeK [Synechocystis sp.]|nr:bis(5'-nucleosyl)-tetraphosphatase (symmetrical) YqeK [Synechocystis sp.]